MKPILFPEGQRNFNGAYLTGERDIWIDFNGDLRIFITYANGDLRIILVEMNGDLRYIIFVRLIKYE